MLWEGEEMTQTLYAHMNKRKINKNKRSLMQFCIELFSFLYFGSTRVWIQSLVLVKQALYYLSHAPSSFTFSCFLDRTLCFCLELLPILFLLCVAGATGTHHHTRLVFWDREGLINFWLGCPQTAILLSLPTSTLH
jgi:hypothetical protein